MTEAEVTETARTIERALDELDRLYQEVDAAVRAHPDPDEAFRYASDFATKVHVIHDQQEIKLRELRNDQAARIRDEKALSLRKLATRIGVSKSRADQMVKDAAERTGKEGEP